MQSRARALVFGAQLSALVLASARPWPNGRKRRPNHREARLQELSTACRSSASCSASTSVHSRSAPVVLLQTQAIPTSGKSRSSRPAIPRSAAASACGARASASTGKLYDRVPFRITAEFSSDEQASARLNDAWFGYDKWKALQFYAGARNVPFSRIRDRRRGRQRADRAAPRRARDGALPPARHPASRATSGRARSATSLGVYNGLERSDRFFEGFGENAALFGNRFDGLTYAGRLDERAARPPRPHGARPQARAASASARARALLQQRRHARRPRRRRRRAHPLARLPPPRRAHLQPLVAARRCRRSRRRRSPRSVARGSSARSGTCS